MDAPGSSTTTLQGNPSLKLNILWKYWSGDLLNNLFSILTVESQINTNSPNDQTTTRLYGINGRIRQMRWGRSDPSQNKDIKQVLWERKKMAGKWWTKNEREIIPGKSIQYFTLYYILQRYVITKCRNHLIRRRDNLLSSRKENFTRLLLRFIIPDAVRCF
jgi:hypothetical protein